MNVKQLADLASTDADMRTIVLIGSSKTRTIARSDGGIWVYTPRQYQDAPAIV